MAAAFEATKDHSSSQAHSPSRYTQRPFQGLTELQPGSKPSLSLSTDTPVGSINGAMEIQTVTAVERRDDQSGHPEDGGEASRSAEDAPRSLSDGEDKAGRMIQATISQEDINCADKAYAEAGKGKSTQNTHVHVPWTSTEAPALQHKTFPQCRLDAVSGSSDTLDSENSRQITAFTGTCSLPGSISPVVKDKELVSDHREKIRRSSEKPEALSVGNAASRDSTDNTTFQVASPSTASAPDSGNPMGGTNGFHADGNVTSTPDMPNRGIHASKYAPSVPHYNYTSRNQTFAEKFDKFPRAPRRTQFSNVQQYNDRYDSRDEVRNIQAQLRKVHEILGDERKAHKTAIENIADRIGSQYEVALQQITSHLLGQRVGLIQQTVHLKEKELDLNSRETLLRKIEELLVIGQKQIAGAGVDDQRLKKYIDVNEEIIQERVTREIGRLDRKADAHLAIKREELKTREAAIDARENAYFTMYKAQASERLEASIRVEVEQATTTREDAAYKRGLAEGRAKGQVEGNGELRSTFYDMGFAACHDMFDRMKRFQPGSLFQDSRGLACPSELSNSASPFTQKPQIDQRCGVICSPPQQTLNPFNSYTPLPSADTGSQVASETVSSNEIATSAKSHPYAYAVSFTERNSTEANRTQLGGSSPRGRLDEHRSDAANAMVDSTFGVPQYGTRTATRPLHPSTTGHTHPSEAPNTGSTPIESDIATGARTNTSVANSSTENSTFPTGKALFVHGHLFGEDDKAHKEDEQVDLIDLE